MMFSKCLQLGMRAPIEAPLLLRIPLLNSRNPKKLQLIEVRRSSNLIPPNQYDSPWSKKMQFGTVIRNNWEVIPLFVVTGIAFLILLIAVMWAVQNKVDVTYVVHNNMDTISRTMHLYYPSCHKFITINQEYIPWPEMHDTQIKMIYAEKRALSRAESCKYP